MEFDKADDYRDGRGAQRDAQFNDLWAACPIDGAFYLDKSLNNYNTVLSKASRYGKALGCKFKVRDLGEQLKVNKYSLDVEKVLRKKKQDETPRLKHEDIRDYNMEEQQERELQANNWREPVKSLKAPWDDIVISSDAPPPPWGPPLKPEIEPWNDSVKSNPRNMRENEPIHEFMKRMDELDRLEAIDRVAYSELVSSSDQNTGPKLMFDATQYQPAQVASQNELKKEEKE